MPSRSQQKRHFEQYYPNFPSAARNPTIQKYHKQVQIIHHFRASASRVNYLSSDRSISMDTALNFFKSRTERQMYKYGLRQNLSRKFASFRRNRRSRRRKMHHHKFKRRRRYTNNFSS